MHFPCVRIQENFKDKDDLIRIGLQKIRVSNIWYGDYRAQVGACRTGERRLKELVGAIRHGDDQGTSSKPGWTMASAAPSPRSGKLPAGTYIYEVRHDPVAGVADEGVPIKAKVTVDPEGRPDHGRRARQSGLRAGRPQPHRGLRGRSCRIGVYYNLDSSDPAQSKAAPAASCRCLRDGCVVGRPKHPIGTSCATSNVNERLANAVQCCFSEMGEPYGMAEGGGNFSAALGVVSGVDRRRKTSMSTTSPS